MRSPVKYANRYALAAALALCFAQAGFAATLNIKVSEFDSATGQLMVQVVANEDAYAGRQKPAAARMLNISATTPVSLAFADLPAGKYAVMVIHDKNSNGKLDSNIIGIPKEGYGFSNNPKVMRQPTFAEASFDIGKDDLSIAIELR